MEYAVDPNGDSNTDDHVDIANMSLGSAYGRAFDDDMALAVDNARRSGCSRSRRRQLGDLAYVSGSPAASRTALSVAQTSMPTLEMNEVSIAAAPAQSFDALYQWWSAPFVSTISAPLQHGDGAGATPSVALPSPPAP